MGHGALIMVNGTTGKIDFNIISEHLRLPSRIRSISPKNLCRTVTLLKYGVICWTSLTLIAVSLARPESRMILLTVRTITFQGYFYARSKVGVWLAWVAWAELWPESRRDQSTVSWPAQGHSAQVTMALPGQKCVTILWDMERERSSLEE